jgi:hypothetical protein
MSNFLTFLTVWPEGHGFSDVSDDSADFGTGFLTNLIARVGHKTFFPLSLFPQPRVCLARVSRNVRKSECTSPLDWRRKRP